MWREVLKIEKIGVYDNFFELRRAFAAWPLAWSHACERNFNIDLPLRKLFELPTVAGLAEHIDFLRRNQSGVSIPPIVPSTPRSTDTVVVFTAAVCGFCKT